MAARQREDADLAARFQQAADALRAAAARDAAAELRALERIRDGLGEIEKLIERRIATIEQAM